MMTKNEVARTAFRYLPNENYVSPYGYTHNRDKNEMCPYCKNEDTDIVRDTAYLVPFVDFYGENVQRFTVMNCWCCSAIWSFYVPNGALG